MASITKSSGAWLAQVQRKGANKSQRFRLKTDAVMWVTKIEADLEAHNCGDLPNYTLLDALIKYESEVTPQHKVQRPIYL